jgi:hypothetical protein
MSHVYVVRRSAWRMWGVSIVGVPMIVVAIDILNGAFTERDGRITTFLRELLFRPDDTQLPEPRETVWGVALLVVGLVLCVWGLRELVAPTKRVVADEHGLKLRLRGPFQRPVDLPWSAIEDLGSGTVDDEGDLLPVVWLRLVDTTGVPEYPWGARWLDRSTLALLAADWDVSHIAAARRISGAAAPPPDSASGTPLP